MGTDLRARLNHAPSACWLFCAPEPGLQQLVEGVVDAVGTPHLVGCTTDGEISERGIRAKAAVLVGVATDQISFEVAYVENISKDPEAAGKWLGRRFSSASAYLQLFSDGLTASGCAVLAGVEKGLGRGIPISGGTAGDDGKFNRTWQFAGRRVFTNGLVGIGLAGNFRVGLGLHSGWSPIGLTKTITRASGNVLYELNHEPALEVYSRFLGKHARKLPAVGVEYPLGLVDTVRHLEGTDYCLLRATMSVNRQEGSITFAGDLPEGAAVRLTCADSASILEAARRAAHTARYQLGNLRPLLGFVYSCMARKIVLGRRIGEELNQIQQVVGHHLPLGGFFTYGEFSPIPPDTVCRLHNETVTVALIGIEGL